MTDTVTTLRDREAKLQSRVKRARLSLESAESELVEVRTALKVLAKLGLVDDVVNNEGPPQPINESHKIVLKWVPEAPDHRAPKDIHTCIVALEDEDMSADYVRTVLWRLAQRGVIHSKDGLYWREKEEASGDEPKASSSVGPHGGEAPLPSRSPEGSNPSGSTPVQPAYDADLDDDVPF